MIADDPASIGGEPVEKRFAGRNCPLGLVVGSRPPIRVRKCNHGMRKSIADDEDGIGT